MACAGVPGCTHTGASPDQLLALLGLHKPFRGWSAGLWYVNALGQQTILRPCLIAAMAERRLPCCRSLAQAAHQAPPRPHPNHQAHRLEVCYPAFTSPVLLCPVLVLWNRAACMILGRSRQQDHHVSKFTILGLLTRFETHACRRLPLIKSMLSGLPGGGQVTCPSL